MILKQLQIWAIKAAIRQIRKVETKLEQMQK